jgi:hypothetical protein
MTTVSINYVHKSGAIVVLLSPRLDSRVLKSNELDRSSAVTVPADSPSRER